MDNTQLKTERTERRLERIVLIVLSLYTAASFATGLLSGWSIYIRELLFVPTVSGWFIYFREYWDHPRRAVFICISCWTEFILYALFTDSFSAMLVTMAGVIVLLSIFNTQQILYPGLVVPFFLFCTTALSRGPSPLPVHAAHSDWASSFSQSTWLPWSSGLSRKTGRRQANF